MGNLSLEFNEENNSLNAFISVAPALSNCRSVTERSGDRTEVNLHTFQDLELEKAFQCTLELGMLS